mmetsp:Transcript_60082/g.161106  ORF Transcript_60082/g.161106 Transcript_60082/m.161106 type:complete len:276 (-) Transcript_60082:658-1485(-)
MAPRSPPQAITIQYCKDTGLPSKSMNGLNMRITISRITPQAAHRAMHQIQSPKVATVYDTWATLAPAIKKNDAVANEFNGMPDMAHGLTGHEHRPGIPGDDESSAQHAQDPGHTQDSFAQDEGPEGSHQRNCDLDNPVVVMSTIATQENECGSQPAYDEANDETNSRFPNNLRGDVRKSEFLLLEQVKRNLIHNHSSTIVHQALPLDQDGEEIRGTQLLEQAHNRDGVGGGKNASQHQAPLHPPADRIRHQMSKSGSGKSSDDNTRASQHQDLPC